MCALSLMLTPCCKGGAHKRQRAAAAHIKRGVRLPPPPLGWLASFIINAMRAGDLDFEKLSSNTGVARTARRRSFGGGGDGGGGTGSRERRRRRKAPRGEL